jgi:hypothetical protein
MIAAHEAYIAGIKASVPSHQLLIFSVAEGWDPLCKFLGLQVPQIPFPRVNETEAMRALPVYITENAAGLLGITAEEVRKKYAWKEADA